MERDHRFYAEEARVGGGVLGVAGGGGGVVRAEGIGVENGFFPIIGLAEVGGRLDDVAAGAGESMAGGGFSASERAQADNCPGKDEYGAYESGSLIYYCHFFTKSDAD